VAITASKVFVIRFWYISIPLVSVAEGIGAGKYEAKFVIQPF